MPDSALSARRLAAASLVRAFLLDDADAGLLIMSQNGVPAGAGGSQVRGLLLAVAELAVHAVQAANGYDVARTLAVLDGWTAEAGRQAGAAP